MNIAASPFPDTFDPSDELTQMLKVAATGPVVGIALPAGVMMCAATAFALACMIAMTRSCRLMPMIVQGADPAASRNQMVTTLLNEGAEYILFIDSDMVFPPDTLNRLLSHDLDIVGADYRKRAPPYQRIGTYLPHMIQSEEGLSERGMLGLGLLLVKRKVFETVEIPWFARIYEREVMMTEDLWFCAHAMEKGFQIWCDVDLTKHVEHIGSQPVPWIIPNEPK